MVNRLSPTLFARHCTRQEPIGQAGWQARGCLLWQGALQPLANAKIPTTSGLWEASRASWHVHNGPIPPGMHVLQHCGHRNCCEPVHLFLDIHKDAVNENLHKHSTRNRKLNAVDVERILAGGEDATTLAAALNVTRASIYNVRNGRRKQSTAAHLLRAAPRATTLDKRRLAVRV